METLACSQHCRETSPGACSSLEDPKPDLRLCRGSLGESLENLRRGSSLANKRHFLPADRIPSGYHLCQNECKWMCKKICMCDNACVYEGKNSQECI